MVHCVQVSVKDAKFVQSGVNKVEINVVHDHVKEQVEKKGKRIEFPRALEIWLIVGREERSRDDEGAGG